MKIEKEADAVKVYVDDNECLNYTFDADKGSRLATYAARCVENAILTQKHDQIVGNSGFRVGNGN